MFRPKPQTPAIVGRKNLLGEKDRKNLRKDFLAQFPSKTRADFETLVPGNSCAEILLVREPMTPSPVQLYLSDNVPLFISYSKKKKSGASLLVPTLQCLHRMPDLLPSFVCPSVVSTFLLRGADLMLPGCMAPSGGYKAMGLEPEQPWAVRVYGNPLPVAVGLTLIGGAEADESEKGRVMEILHMYGDMICSFPGGDGDTLMTSPPDGFTTTQVYPAASQAAGLGEDKLPEEWVARLQKFEKTGHEPTTTDNNPPPPPPPVSSEVSTSAQESEAATIVPPPPINEKVVEDVSSSTQKATPTTSANAQKALPPAVADAVLEFCLCECLKSQINMANLPIDTSAIYSGLLRVLEQVYEKDELMEYLSRKHLVPTNDNDDSDDNDDKSEEEKKWSRADLRNADVKQTKHKNFKNFVRSYVKANVFGVKEVRGNTVLVRVNVNHPLLKNHNCVLASPTATAAAAATAGGQKRGGGQQQQQQQQLQTDPATNVGKKSSAKKSDEITASSAGTMPTNTNCVRMLSLYKPLTEAKEIFEVGTAGTDLEKNELFSKEEVYQILDTYFRALDAGSLINMNKNAEKEFPSLGEDTKKDGWSDDESEDEKSLVKKTSTDEVEQTEVKALEGLPRCEQVKKVPILRALLLSKPQRKELKETNQVSYNCTDEEISKAFLNRAVKIVTLVCPANTSMADVLANPSKFKFVETDEPPKIVVSVHRARGHIKTKVSGIHNFASVVEAKQLAEHLKKACAASATVKELDEIKGMRKPLGVEVQGDVSQAIVTVLQKQYGIPKDMIRVTSSSV